MHVANGHTLAGNKLTNTMNVANDTRIAKLLTHLSFSKRNLVKNKCRNKKKGNICKTNSVNKLSDIDQYNRSSFMLY